MKYFTNFTFKSMKKILLSIALVAFIMLGTMSVAKATTVTFYVTINLTDTCGGGYSGYYCVNLNLTYYGTSVLCTSKNCIINGSGCYAFTCDLDAIAQQSHYGVAFVSACRYPSNTCCATSGIGSTGFSWLEMTNNSPCYATLTLTF